MNQKYGKIFLLAMMLMALGLGINACSDSDDPVTPPPGGGDDETDTTAPILITTTPEPGATGLDINQVIIAIFSEPLDPASLTGNITISPGLVVDFVQTGNEVQIVHNPFNEGDAIEITFAVGITDTSGNHLAAPITHQYYVATDEVVVIEHHPADGSTNFLRNVPVTIKFNQTMDSVSLAAGINASVPDKANLEFGINSLGNSTYALEFNDDLPAETEVTITIGTTCESNIGTTLETVVVFSFETSADIDDTPPEIVSFFPASGSTVSGENFSLVITFDKPIENNYISVTGFDVHTLVAFMIPGAMENWNADYTVVTLVYGSTLPNGVNLSLQFGDFMDTLGNINTSHPLWTVTTSGIQDHYPVDERLVYIFESYETGNGAPVEPYIEMTRNVWSSADHFMHQEYNYAEEDWTEWDNMIRTASATQLNGFRELEEGIAADVTFDHPVQFLNHPTVPATWSDNVVVTTPEGTIDVAFSVEVLSGEEDFPFNMSMHKSLMLPGFLMGDKSVEQEFTFPDCRTVIQVIAGSMEGSLVFTETDTMVFCPGFGLIRENALESNTYDEEDRYSTSEIIGFDVPRP